MAQTLETLTIEIRAQGKEFSSAISQMQSQLKSFESSTKGSLGSIESSVKSIGSSFSSMLSVAAGINLAGIFQSAVSQAESLVTQGIAYNATLEQGKIAIAALLQGTTQLTDSDGKKLTASASWNENLQEAGRLQTEIAGMSATTLGTQEELMNVFRTALAYSRGQHATTSELLEFSQGMLNVGKLQGLNSAQLEIETRQILQLESARGQVVLPLLGYSIQQARSYKDQHNEIQKLNERLAVYKDLAQASATSWTGLTTSASTFTSLISANTFTETFGGIKEILAGFTQESIRLQQAGGLTSELDATGAGLRLLGVVGADAYAGIVRGAANAVNAILEFADAVDQTSHSPAWQAIATALSGGAIKTALVWLVRSIYDLGEVLDDVATAFIARMASLPIALSAAVAAAAQFKNPVEAFLESSKGSGQFENEALADLEFRLKRISGLGEDGKKAFHENLIGTTFASTTTLDQQRASLGPLFNPLTRTGLPGNNSEADAAAKRHATLIKNTQEQIAELAAKNAVLRESLALNLSTNEAEAKAAGAALAQKTGSKELGDQLAKQTEAHKNLMAAQQAQFQAQQKLAASQLALPQVLATINAGLAAGTPWKQIEEQIKAVEGQSKIIEAFRATGQSPDATLAAFNQATLNEQAKNRAQEGGAFFSSTRKGLLDEIEADQTRIAVMQQDIAVGKSYEQTQRDIAVALELVKLHQNDVTASLDASKVAELEKLITDKAELDKAADDMAKQQQLAENISSDITSAFQSMAQNIGNAFSIMRSTVLGIVNDIAKEILRRQVVKPLAEMINKWLGGILGTGADKDKTIKANNVYVNGRLVGGGGQEGAGGVGGAAGSIWGLGNDGWLPGIVGGGSIDKAAQDALGKGEINANDVIWKSMEGEAGQASGGGIFSGISNFFSGITSKIGSVFSGLFSGGGGMFSSLFSGIGSIFSGGSGILSSLMGFLPFLHSGGIAGAASSYRVASIGAFAGAPRFHSGLMPGEIAAILKDDEGVFTKDQMQALGRGRGGITIINNVQTPDLAGFQRTRDQRAVNDRISMEVAHRRYG